MSTLHDEYESLNDKVEQLEDIVRCLAGFNQVYVTGLVDENDKRVTIVVDEGRTVLDTDAEEITGEAGSRIQVNSKPRYIARYLNRTFAGEITSILGYKEPKQYKATACDKDIKASISNPPITGTGTTVIDAIVDAIHNASAS